MLRPVVVLLMVIAQNELALIADKQKSLHHVVGYDTFQSTVWCRRQPTYKIQLKSCSNLLLRCCCCCCSSTEKHFAVIFLKICALLVLSLHLNNTYILLNVYLPLCRTLAKYLDFFLQKTVHQTQRTCQILKVLNIKLNNVNKALLERVPQHKLLCGEWNAFSIYKQMFRSCFI